jgi:hypothetical protein
MHRLRRLVVLLVVFAALSPILFNHASPATADDAATPIAEFVPESTPEPTQTAESTETPLPTATDVPVEPTATPTTAPAVEAADDGEVVAAAVTPGLSLSTSEGTVGATLRVEVRNFPALKRVGIYFDGARKVTLETDANGKARGSFNVPAAGAGAHTIEAVGSGKRASKTFTVLPKLAFNKSTVTAGQQLTATLTGFSPNTTAKIRLYDLNASSTAVSVWIASIGADGGAKLTVTTKASTKPGAHEVVATDTPTRWTSGVTVTVVKPQPTATPTKAPTRVPTSTPNCHPSYPTLCLRYSPDLNCPDIGVKDFPVVGSDPHRLDADNDGIGCES